MNFSPEVLNKLALLKEKYDAAGQDLESYLDGLYHTDFLKYWDYIHLDTLLTLQKPRTSFPDEMTFIIYHQITELYFKLMVNAIESITENPAPTREVIIKYLNRANRYLRHLISSFDVMIEGMDKEQFRQFRMALLPASGFQSAHYRLIELRATDALNLVNWKKKKEISPEADIRAIYENLYWKQGGRIEATHEKTLTLKDFEAKYEETFIETIEDYQKKNIWQKYLALPKTDQKDPELIKTMRLFDHFMEVRWPFQHYLSAKSYLIDDPDVIAATGGTNWQKYLPPRTKMIHLYPALWDDNEKRDWGVKNVRPEDTLD